VSGAFHSPLMQGAADRLSEVLAKGPFSDAKIPVVANVTADYVRSATEIRESLARQIAGSVRWEESVARMVNDDVKIFIEVGPGKVLAGLIKRISDAVEVRSIGDKASLES